MRVRGNYLGDTNEAREGVALCLTRPQTTPCWVWSGDETTWKGYFHVTVSRTPPPPPPGSPYFLNLASTFLLIKTGVFEFICSQSPHSMKGLLIGVLYTIRGFYQAITAILLIPFYFIRHLFRISPSCGFHFYLLIGLVAVLAYVGC